MSETTNRQGDLVAGTLLYRVERFDDNTTVFEYRLVHNLTAIQLGHRAPATIVLERTKFRGQPRECGQRVRVSRIGLSWFSRSPQEAVTAFKQSATVHEKEARRRLEEARQELVVAFEWAAAWKGEVR